MSDAVCQPYMMCAHQHNATVMERAYHIMNTKRIIIMPRLHIIIGMRSHHKQVIRFQSLLKKGKYTMANVVMSTPCQYYVILEPK